MKLSIVVTCSDRKAEPPTEELRARNLPLAGVDVRSSAWRSRLRRAGSGRSLSDLYRGEGWSLWASLRQAGIEAGFEPRLLVASAGLGLRTVESSAPPYSATFATGQQDTVASTSGDSRLWWRSLRQTPSALDMSALSGSVLLILSAAYASAMRDDLVAVGARGDDIMLVGGATDIPGVSRLPAERALRSALGGTATGLNVRMARRWLRELDGPRLTSESRMRLWGAWADTARRRESWDRISLDDAEVLAFIREALRVEPTLSRTRALRTLRDSGRACEQTRFAALYTQAVGTA